MLQRNAALTHRDLPGAGGPRPPTATHSGSVAPLKTRRVAGLATAAPRVSVVIPAKNEARNLPGVLAELPAGLHEVILVDGGSVDGTVQTVLRIRPDVVVVHQTRRGKGNALACGFAACTGDIIVMLDADGSADPAEIPEFVAALVGGCDFAKGSRFLRGGGSTDLTPLRRLGNRVLAVTMNSLYRTSYSDLCYGYNAFWTRCLDRLDLPAVDGPAPVMGDGFEIETLLAAHAATAGLAITEVPSFERDRRFGESNLNTWRDGWRVLRTILREKQAATAQARLSLRQQHAATSVEAVKWP
jgi:glycosyltransferase involved in cell wall biosynthesis